MQKINSSSNLETVSVFVSGKVQGVGFRAATVRHAHQIKLGGWVRNLSDGRVEVLIQGTNTQIDDMLSWLLHGPRTASVTDVVHEEVQTDTLYQHFAQI